MRSVQPKRRPQRERSWLHVLSEGRANVEAWAGRGAAVDFPDGCGRPPVRACRRAQRRADPRRPPPTSAVGRHDPRDRQRHRTARDRVRGGAPGAELAAERPGPGGARQHCGVDRGRESRQRAARRSTSTSRPRTGRARSPGRCKAFSASTCCTSRRGRRARAWWRAPRRCSSAARRSTSTGRSSRAAGTPRQATPSSTAICAPAIRPGACVTGRGGRVRRPPRPRSGGRRADAGEQSFGDPAPLLNQAGRRRIGDRGRDGLPTRSGARMLPASTAREGSPR